MAKLKKRVKKTSSGQADSLYVGNAANARADGGMSSNSPGAENSAAAGRAGSAQNAQNVYGRTPYAQSLYEQRQREGAAPGSGAASRQAGNAGTASGSFSGGVSGSFTGTASGGASGTQGSAGANAAQPGGEKRKKKNKNKQAKEKKTGKRRRRALLLRLLVLFVVLFAAVYGIRRLIHYAVPSTNVRTSVTWEAGTEWPQASDFLKTGDSRASLTTELSTLSLNTVGSYSVELKIGKKTYESTLQVRDTTAPQAIAVDADTTIGVEVEAEAFVSQVFDATDVTISYASEPDFSVEGQQEVTILLTDSAGNTAKKKAHLNVNADSEEPVIEGVHDQTVYEGDTISYKSGVTVTDNAGDDEVELEIDNSEVDLNTAGTYTVTYTATDSAGNSTSTTATITVEELVGEENLEEMQEAAQAILDEIFTDDMDEEAQLFAIFSYVQDNMSYTGTSDKTSYINEAIRGFTEKDGDCFTFYAMMKALMEQAGFETINVEREGGETEHYWSLVYFNDAWYHIDACFRRDTRNPEWLCFLRIDSELEEFSAKYEGYYDFDADLYPATPEEAYNSDYIADVDI